MKLNPSLARSLTFQAKTAKLRLPWRFDDERLPFAIAIRYEVGKTLFCPFRPGLSSGIVGIAHENRILDPIRADVPEKTCPF
jgi:hypothetical protein